MAFTFEMLLTLSLMIFAIIGYSTRKLPIDAVSISVLGLLFLIFEIYPVDGISFDDFIAGFSNHGLLTVMALLVVAQGVYSTGILNTFVDNIMHLNRDLQTSKSTMLILLLFYAMYILAWRIFDKNEKVIKITSVIAILGVINVPIIKFSVDWWSTLHQDSSVNILSESTIHSSMLVPLLLMTAAFSLFSLLIFLMKYNTELIKIKNKGLDLSLIHI